MTSVEIIANFRTVIDPYNGLTIDSKDLPNTKEEFKKDLLELLEKVKHTRNLLWIYIDIKKSDFIPIATSRGFIFHSCDEDYILLVKQLKKNVTIPTAANHTLGVGAVVINDNNEVLVIKEKVSNVGFKLPGGHIDNAEMISVACEREVFEETGVKVQFEKIVSLGHFYPHQFHKSNLYVICLAKPLTSEINILDTQEIIDAKWIDIEEYLADENVISYSKALVKAALIENGLVLDDKGLLTHIEKNIELFFNN